MIIAILAPLLVACFIPLLSKIKHRVHTGFFVLLVPLSIFTYFVTFVGRDFSTQLQVTKWIPSLDINFSLYLDGLSLLFVLLITGIGSLVVLYSIYYLDRSERLDQFYVYLLMFMTAMLGVVLSDNIFVLYTFWELTSISSFLLIGYWHYKERSRYGALKSMLITVFGGLSMFGGFVLLYVVTGTTSIQDMIAHPEIVWNSAYLPLILAFILLGAFTKSAQFPFHIWLPDAMEAPTPVSAYLHSATMVKAGLFLIARFSPLLSASEWFYIVVTSVGVITLCWGSYMAVRQTDLKAILAFSTISQLGMIMAMFGFGTKIAIFAAVFHILNHATFKGSLFMIAGIIDHETGTRDIRKLGGLATIMPIAATLTVLGTFSMAGIPLPFLNGFYSKELFIDSALHLEGGMSTIASMLTAAIPYLVVFGSIFTFVYSMYFLFGIFTGKHKADQLPKPAHEAPFGMLLPPIILITGVVVIGLFPNLVNGTLLNHAQSAVGNTLYDVEKIKFWHGWDAPAFQVTLLIISVGIALYLTRKKWQHIYNALPGSFSFNRVYDALIKQLDRTSEKITNAYMTGSLRLYMTIIIAAIIVVTTTVMMVTDGFVVKFDNLADVSVLELVVAGVMVVAAVWTIFTNHKLAAILITGVVGYGVAILFILYRAPDLALTQLVIETVSVALFLLAFYHLPQLQKRDDSTGSKIVNATISIGFGALVAMIGIAAHSSSGFAPISDYFIKTSHTLGGGDNIVNVILVDMRGLDTLFEITVLGIAALAIYSLIKLRNDKEAE
ncbi:Na+/H+ antiporter subunit A [Lentibacillus saliphilus]|uniref:Na+/H+ antiporter subunit A n=1 Tax=Lentibacillus saliphilus TaxID=2737028 RepID=UPI001C30E27C|nr:Na+/H+ antiporter subunit A [Lentibacillus saliphilus]